MDDGRDALTPPADLDGLRAELARVDQALLELVARRLGLASAIGDRKRAQGLSTRDYSQEKEVVERAQRIAAALGVSPDLADRLLQLLIASSLARQEQEGLVASAGGAGRRALVIGGSGRMGGWFLRFLGSQGFALENADPELGPAGVPRLADWRASRLDQDVIVLAAPLQATAGILHELAARRPRGLVFDIGSLKGPLVEGLTALAQEGVRVASVHPMFGPDTELLSGRHVIFVDCGVAEAVREARALFAPTMALQVEMTAAEHDRLIAYVLGLSHATNIAFFTALAASGEAVPELARMSSTTFDAQLDIAARLAAENPRLYFEIQSLNPYGREPLRALRQAVDAVLDAVTREDQPAFVGLMERGKAYLAGSAAPRS